MPSPRRVLALVARWLAGTVLVTWRYLWATTPLHRTESPGGMADRPPRVAPEVLDDRVQLDGYGPLFHRSFRARVAGTKLDAGQLVDLVVHDFKHFVPTEVVDVHFGASGGRALDVGDELLVEMPGPWNGPVRIAHRDRTTVRLVTLRGHLEAGQVQFRAAAENGLLVFEIELWARAANRLVHLLYAHLRFAKEVQLNMWVRFCLAAVTTSGGELVDGVHITTRRLDRG
ncbi:hypothetical protein FHX82_005098 [Amycolatopsis bartoniae]|uniref:DUF1990 domain-containing protein n=1 Tax=Amycolatopsis bartoniae TaxID=941986 RepID=A0A8H9IPB1_9PSEU|nr:DUF1990 family protein [Amycolatopsis bartoniae]MBB2938022.1 hypothetical protein [Amycolatopsis bartoniae]TVT06126.1 DUF1990 domain-containing protein [Amycolatopsis bartoniae]GHF42402.1 hypothetical protein GCM10017566_14990 [Amycolatopsis bartoniae]